MAFKKLSLILLPLLFFTLFTPAVFAKHEPIDIVYFYGDGCPHCNDFEEWLEEIKPDYNINPVGFEVYSNDTNRQLAMELSEEYGESFRGVPMIFLCDQAFVGFSRSGTGNKIIEHLEICTGHDCHDSPLDKVKMCDLKESKKEKLTFLSVMVLALADSVNPCALAVLAMALLALLARDPSKKKRVLLGGLAFVSAVFMTYMVYGGIIIQFFKSIQSLFTSISYYVRIIFAMLAIFIGFMNLKDFVKYRPGSLGTEMPVKMRPMAKRIIANITSPGGAFIIGIFVTLFLLPCTIGPYLVVGNLLSGIAWLKILPWLVFYNLIFVLPMLLITLFVYAGMTKVQDVTGWKDKNIRWLHFAAGIVLMALGVAMLLGLV